MLKRLAQLAYKVAPELAQSHLRLLWHQPTWPAPVGAAAYAVSSIHPPIRAYLEARGEWRGMWPAAVVLVDQLTEPEMHTILLHEIAHLLPARPACPDFDITPSRQIEVASAMAAWSAAPAEVPPWHQHGAPFIRRALHLHHRAARLGVDAPLDGLCAGYTSYRLSHPAAYRDALGDEPARMSEATFAQIAATPAPREFEELFRNDTDIWNRKQTRAITWQQ